MWRHAWNVEEAAEIPPLFVAKQEGEKQKRIRKERASWHRVCASLLSTLAFTQCKRGSNWA